MEPPGIPELRSFSEQNDFFSFTDSSGFLKLRDRFESYLQKQHHQIDLKDRILTLLLLPSKKTANRNLSVTGKNLLFNRLFSDQPQALSQTPHLSQESI